MLLLLTILNWTLASVTGLVALFWLLAAARILRSRRSVPTVRAGCDRPPGDPVRVSIIVPAHNEERVIETCLASILAQDHADLEVIAVLDRCTDGTTAIVERLAASDPRLTIIENEACPADWAGKCHAARLGAAAATGDLLLFTDADTEFAPSLVRASVAMLRDRRAGLLSLLSTLRVAHPFEFVVQPVATFTLVQMYPIERVGRTDRARPFANGQFMLFRRDVYERIGGHDAVKDDLLEDIAFARRVHESGSRVVVLLADGMLRCAMYDSAAAFRSGWKRIFIEACKRKPARLRKHAWRVFVLGPAASSVIALTFAAGVAQTVVHAAGPGPMLLGAALAAAAAQGAVVAWVYRIGGAPIAAAALFPVGSAILARLLWEASADLRARRPITWAGREYVLEPR